MYVHLMKLDGNIDLEYVATTLESLHASTESCIQVQNELLNTK